MSKSTSALQQIAQVRKKFGTRAAIRFTADRLGRRLLRSEIDHVVWLDVDEVTLSLDLDPEFEARFLTADEIREFGQDPENLLDEELISRGSSPLDFCFAVLSGSRLAAYGWYAVRCIESHHCAGTALSYPDNVAYMYTGFTHPDFRGKRLHGVAMGMALKALGEQGVTKLVSIVNWTNEASLRSCERLGYRDLGRIYSFFGRGRCQTSFYPRRAQELRVKFGKEADLSARANQHLRLAQVEQEEPAGAGV